MLEVVVCAGRILLPCGVMQEWWLVVVRRRRGRVFVWLLRRWWWRVVDWLWVRVGLVHWWWRRRVWVLWCGWWGVVDWRRVRLEHWGWGRWVVVGRWWWGDRWRWRRVVVGFLGRWGRGVGVVVGWDFRGEAEKDYGKCKWQKPRPLPLGTPFSSNLTGFWLCSELSFCIPFIVASLPFNSNLHLS